MVPGNSRCATVSGTETGLVVAAQIVLTIESLDTSASLNSLLLTGVERMALGANFNRDLGYSRSNDEFVTAMALNLALIILGMDSFLHGEHLFHGYFA